MTVKIKERRSDYLELPPCKLREGIEKKHICFSIKSGYGLKNVVAESEKTEEKTDKTGGKQSEKRCVRLFNYLGEINNELFNDYPLDMLINNVCYLTSGWRCTQRKQTHNI